MPYKNTRVLFLTIDALSGTGRVTKSLPRRRAGEVRWRLVINLPPEAPVQDITLDVPDETLAESLDIQPVVEVPND